MLSRAYLASKRPKTQSELDAEAARARAVIMEKAATTLRELNKAMGRLRQCGQTATAQEYALSVQEYAKELGTAVKRVRDLTDAASLPQLVGARKKQIDDAIKYSKDPVFRQEKHKEVWMKKKKAKGTWKKNPPRKTFAQRHGVVHVLPPSAAVALRQYQGAPANMEEEYAFEKNKKARFDDDL